MKFDFVAHLYNFRYRKWYIDNVGTRASKVFCLQYVFGLYKNKSLPSVRRRLSRFRKRWISRIRELAALELWFPTKQQGSPYAADFDVQKFNSGFKRCLYCRPVVVHFYSSSGELVPIRPCWRTHICPFCWANLITAQYVYVKNAVNRLSRSTAGLIAVCRIVREYVPAPGFNYLHGTDPAQVAEHTKLLMAVIHKHRQAYASLITKKTLQRRTLGSAWRVVVTPDEAGWFVETRQFFVTRARQKARPFVNIRGATVAFSRSIKLDTPRGDLQAAFYELFGEFCRYPETLLSGYSQLVAAYLHATHNTRLVSGTGVFHKTGRALIPYMREYSSHVRARKTKGDSEASGTAAQDA